MRKLRVYPPGVDMGNLTPPGEIDDMPLETLPMPRPHVPDNEKPPEPAATPGIKRGANGQFQPGGSSPNPRGRPIARISGEYTARMMRKRVVRVNGKVERLSDRERLDQVVRRRAMEGDAKARKLFEARWARDTALEQRLEHHRQLEQARRSGQVAHSIAESSYRFNVQRDARDRLYAAMQERLSNLEEIVTRLEALGAVIRHDGQLSLAPWLKPPGTTS